MYVCIYSRNNVTVIHNCEVITLVIRVLVAEYLGYNEFYVDIIVVDVIFIIPSFMPTLLLLLLLLLLLSSSLSSSSSSPLCRVFILIFLRETMSLGNTVLQLFCCYYSWCLHRYFQCWICCTFTLVLSEVCVQCPIWLFSVVPWLHVFLVLPGTSRIFWMTLK